MTQIMGIAGVMGAGKTTLAQSLAVHLQATVVCWDDYDEISSGPEDFVEWYHTEKDYGAWKYPALAETLKTLKEEKPVQCPATHRELRPTDFVIFDAPLGRKHVETGQYIDYLVWIDLPLDVSLSRWLLRNYRSKEDATASHILDEIEFHLNESRPLFVDNEEIIADADLVVDGMLPVDQLAIEVVGSYLKTSS
jgi:uridine kinase